MPENKDCCNRNSPYESHAPGSSVQTAIEAHFRNRTESAESRVKELEAKVTELRTLDGEQSCPRCANAESRLKAQGEALAAADEVNLEILKLPRLKGYVAVSESAMRGLRSALAKLRAAKEGA